MSYHQGPFGPYSARSSCGAIPPSFVAARAVKVTSASSPARRRCSKQVSSAPAAKWPSVGESSVAPPPVAPRRISNRLWSASGGERLGDVAVLLPAGAGRARAPLAAGARQVGVTRPAAFRCAAGVPGSPAAAPPDADEPAQPAQASNAAARRGVQRAAKERGESEVTVVDADTSLTYHRFFMSPRFRHLFALCALCSFIWAIGLGCAESDDDTRPVTYSLTAKQNYEKGMAELKDESYGEAKKYFQFVKQKFPFSKYAVMAELALADTQFAQGNYTESIESYKSFARLHPTHEKVEDGYVAFRICEGYFKDMPEDIWIMPPSYEKDQSAVNDAARELVRVPQEIPRLALRQEGRRDAQGGPQAARRPRGLRGALLPQERPPQGGGHAHRGGDQALPRLGARAGAALLARRDLPAHGRSAAGQGDLHPRGHRVRRARRRRAARSSTSSTSPAASDRTPAPKPTADSGGRPAHG